MNAEEYQAYVEALMADPVFFMREIWRETGLDKVAPIGPIEEDIIRYGADGPPLRGILAFRGVGKTYLITAGLTCYDLFLDPNFQTLIISKSQTFANTTIALIREWIDTVPFLQHLTPDPAKGHRDTTQFFDVGTCQKQKDPSVFAKGVEGQITGTHAHRVRPDDVETDENTQTLDARQALARKLNELSAVRYPKVGQICYIGTYHHEESVYLEMAQRGYVFRTWPVIYPTPDEAVRMLNPAPYIMDALAEGRAEPGEPTCPYRFPMDRIIQEQAHGRRYFAMQFMLLSDLGDAERYPLRLADLIVFDAMNMDRAPLTITWGRSYAYGASTQVQDIPCYGFSGDGLYGQAMYAPDWGEYLGTKGWLDLSGRGKDRTAVCAIGQLNGFLWTKGLKSWPGGHDDPQVIRDIVLFLRECKVDTLYAEDNFGLGMATQLLDPVLREYALDPGQQPDYPRGWHCGIELVHQREQKELRIIHALEPVMGRHRLVVSRDVIRNEDLQKQLTRITSQRNCLEHDDELDALAGCVSMWQEELNQNPDLSAERIREQRFDDELRAHRAWQAGLKPQPPRFFRHPHQHAGV